LTNMLGKDFPRQEIIDILGDAVDPSHDGDGDGRTKISYSAFLRLWEKNHEKKVRANKLRMLGSQVNLAGGYFEEEDNDDMNDALHSTDDCQEAAKARATFLMDKHGTLGAAAAASRNVGVGDTIFEDAMSTIAALPPSIIHECIDGEDDYSMGGGIQI
jgi:hypothetical protein